MFNCFSCVLNESLITSDNRPLHSAKCKIVNDRKPLHEAPKIVTAIPCRTHFAQPVIMCSDYSRMRSLMIFLLGVQCVYLLIKFSSIVYFSLSHILAGTLS